MYIERDIDTFLAQGIKCKKVLMVYGPRQAGKTTAIENFLGNYAAKDEVIRLNADDSAIKSRLDDASAEAMKQIVGNKSVLFIDEAQAVLNNGLVVKRLFDVEKDIHIILSGSSSFELASKIEEPLTGRKFDYVLLPLSFSELSKKPGIDAEKQQLENRLIYGSYPGVVTAPEMAFQQISSIGSGYLYKDILKYEGIRKPALLEKIMEALAFQIGQEVSYNELASLAGTDGKTVEKYIDILEKAFILFRLPCYSHNLRNELKKSRKIFFYDCGIRNSVIGDFRPLATRTPNEIGSLFENYFISERLKWRLKNAPCTRAFFWRTRQGKEIDLIEETPGKLEAFEIKWNPNKTKGTLPYTFTNAYPNASCHFVSSANYDKFLI